MKKLYRSEKNKVISGVISGLGEYFNIDPTFLRIAFIFVAIFTAIVPAIVFYFLAAMLMPIKGEGENPK